MLPCKTCKGTKEIVSEAFTSLDGVVYPKRINKCSSCQGEGLYPEVNEKFILERILATKGKNKGKIRASMVASWNGNVDERRAYYVWRMARFHGGVDMTQPFNAGLLLRGDPYIDQLDVLVDRVAKEQFGSNLTAAIRWGKAMGHF